LGGPTGEGERRARQTDAAHTLEETKRTAQPALLLTLRDALQRIDVRRTQDSWVSRLGKARMKFRGDNVR
jgi:hypothetical protein